MAFLKDTWKRLLLIFLSDSNLLLGCPTANFSPPSRGYLTNSMLINAFYSVSDPKVTRNWEPLATKRFPKGIKFFRACRKTNSTPEKCSIFAMISAFEFACISYKFTKKISSDWTLYPFYISPETTVPLFAF